MTWEIICSKCGEKLYSGFDLRPPAELLKPCGNRCRRCGAKLLTRDFKLEVVKFDGSFSLEIGRRPASPARESGVPAVAVPNAD